MEQKWHASHASGGFVPHDTQLNVLANHVCVPVLASVLAKNVSATQAAHLLTTVAEEIAARPECRVRSHHCGLAPIHQLGHAPQNHRAAGGTARRRQEQHTAVAVAVEVDVGTVACIMCLVRPRA